MRNEKLYDRVMRGEITAERAANLAGVSEGEVIAWIEARRDGTPRRKSPKRTTRLQHALTLYRESYQGVPIVTFRRALAEEHDIVVPYQALRDALVEDGLVSAAPVSLWRRAKARGPAPQSGVRANSEGRPLPHARAEAGSDADVRLAHNLQRWSDMAERLNSTVRDRIVSWRHGHGPLEAALDAFGELKRFVLSVSK